MPPKKRTKPKPTPVQRPGSWQAPDGPTDGRVVRMRVSPGQRAKMDRAVAFLGETLSGWLRDLAIREANRILREEPDR